MKLLDGAHAKKNVLATEQGTKLRAAEPSLTKRRGRRGCRTSPRPKPLCVRCLLSAASE